MDNEKSIVEEAIDEAKRVAKEEGIDVEEPILKEVSSDDVVDMTSEDISKDDATDSKQTAENKFGKKHKKEKKDKKDEKIEELTDRVTRQMAEFDNFRKRTEKEKSAMYEIGAKDVIDKMLPIVDNFERGLQTVPEELIGNPFVDGMEMVYKQLLTTLEEIGVKAIKAVGEEFNPDFHNAVMHVEDEELGENVVAEEFQKGYTYRDNVVRHSMVKVAN
ncbi:MAG: nucleotide exchange factor GrpE [Lachnospiraceae bacterium]|nr:nucleotide exchange factor GrpE [Lachnospiraceae bacterium]